MHHFYLRLILIPFTLFTIVLILIHTLPYDDHELRALLLPEGCPAPCFMGIRPGITTMDEAVAILQASSWVENIKKESDSFGDTIKWTWNDRIPKQIIPTSEGQIRAAPNFERRLVDTITLSSFLQLGEAYVLLGPPDTETFNFDGYSMGETYGYFDYRALYNKAKLVLNYEQACHTGYPGTGNREAPGVPFTMPVHIQISMQMTMPISVDPIPMRSPIRMRPVCGA